MEEIDLNEKKEDTKYKSSENLSQFRSKANAEVSEGLGGNVQKAIENTLDKLGLKITFRFGPVSVVVEKADKEKSKNNEITKDELGQGVLSL